MRRAFAAVGAYKGSLVDAPPLHCVGPGATVRGSCAMFSGTFGGLAREPTCSSCGRRADSLLTLRVVRCACAFRWARHDDVGPPCAVHAMEAVLLGAWCTVVGRIRAVSHGLRLPVFPAAASSKSLLHVQGLGSSDPPATSKLAEPCFPPSAETRRNPTGTVTRTLRSWGNGELNGELN